jgi:tetratricopeptide (TPR) repeat protein
MSVRTQKPAGKGPAVKGNARPPAQGVAAPAAASHWWLWGAGFAVALIAALIAYWPAMHGEFVFDDVHMHFASVPHPETLSLRQWLTGARPLVDLSYWLNFQMGGVNPFGYHLLNVLLHAFASLMVFAILYKILELAAIETRRRTLVAGFCAAIFLLHPVQTEAVAYIAQRAENLSVALAFAAWVCFLYRPTRDIRFPSVAAVLALSAASVASKEHVAMLPLVILLTDYYWNPGFSLEGVRRNWRLYGCFLLGTAAVAAFLYSYLANEPTIGFNMKEFTLYQYFFTQCRVVFLYLRLFILPFDQTADYTIALSRTPLDHGAIFGMLALLLSTVAAIVWRKRYRLASYGFFVALIFFLPTSSFYPIKDLATERRLYLPMIGLLLILCEVLVRLRVSERLLAGALAAIALIAGVLTWNRSFVWSSPLALWSDTVEKSPQQARAHFGLATADYTAHRYADAVHQYELVKGPDYDHNGMFFSNWALALDAAGRNNEAIEMGRKAIALSPSAPTYTQQAVYLAKNGDIAESLDLLDKAEKADASYEPLYINRGNILMQTFHREQACMAFHRALTLEPGDPSAGMGLRAAGCVVAR